MLYEVITNIGEAYYAIHGGANFMAHVGEKFTFGNIRGFSRSLGILQFELNRFSAAYIFYNPHSP